MIFLLSSLAVWRICHFLAHDDGPWYFMFTIREKAYDAEWWAVYEWLTCVKCNSVWIAFPFAAAIAPMGWLFVTWLALSTATIMLEGLYGMLWKR